MKLYTLPEFLTGRCSEEDYVRWLKRSSSRQFKRDRRRGNTTATLAEYKLAIQAAVLRCRGLDFYTGRALRWDLICKYRNEASKVGRRLYKKEFGDLPTIDHVDDGLGPADFVICSWRINDCKNDLTLPEFIEVCKMVVAASA